MSHKDLKKKYIKLYQQMMKYIWSLNVVELLAELEISVCKMFPIMSDVRNNFNRLESSVRFEIQEDEQFKKAFDEFREMLDQEITFANITDINK